MSTGLVSRVFTAATVAVIACAAAALLGSAGTSAPALVKDINPGEGLFPHALTRLGGTLFFVADDVAHGWELWKSDGTAAGTMLVKDINPGPEASFPTHLTVVGGTLF
ncbi:MAG: ELWxxDGT repeat protein, partial [Steroidobacteraceae bacterium]